MTEFPLNLSKPISSSPPQPSKYYQSVILEHDTRVRWEIYTFCNIYHREQKPNLCPRSLLYYITRSFSVCVRNYTNIKIAFKVNFYQTDR